MPSNNQRLALMAVMANGKWRCGNVLPAAASRLATSGCASQ
eukprot:COSAG01_NODE_60718_length_293_cov_0.798969_1_plen_40_part_10